MDISRKTSTISLFGVVILCNKCLANKLVFVASLAAEAYWINTLERFFSSSRPLPAMAVTESLLYFMCHSLFDAELVPRLYGLQQSRMQMTVHGESLGPDNRCSIRWTAVP